MAIDININNQNKHWILVILEKIKGTVLLIWTYLLKVIRSVGRFLKRIWKILVSVAALVVIIGVGVYCVDYYNNTYIPQKQFEEACSDIEAKFESKIDSIKPQIRNPTKVSERCGPNRQECDFSSLD